MRSGWNFMRDQKIMTDEEIIDFIETEVAPVYKEYGIRSVDRIYKINFKNQHLK
jgi:hypothetical protein